MANCICDRFTALLGKSYVLLQERSVPHTHLTSPEMKEGRSHTCVSFRNNPLHAKDGTLQAVPLTPAGLLKSWGLARRQVAGLRMLGWK